MSHFEKNTAVTGYTFGLVNASDGSDITTGTVTGYVTIDGGTQTALTNSPTHKGNGQWSVNLTAGEMNGDVIGLAFTHASATTTHHTIRTFNTNAVASAVWDAIMADYLADNTTGSFLNSGFIQAFVGTNAINDATNGLVAIKTRLDLVPTNTENADALLTRDFSAVATPSARSVLNALRLNVNKWEIDTVPATPELVVYEEDGITEAIRIPISQNAVSNPIDGFRP